MMEMEGDKARTSFAMAVARMWKDPEYKRQFISDPKSALSREGVNFAEHTRVKVVEDSPVIKYVDIGSGKDEPQEIIGRLLPPSEGRQLRLVQSTDNLRYLILPVSPGWISPGSTGGDDLLKLSAEKTPPMVISETTVLDSQVVTAENVAVEQLIEQSMEAEELIVESTVAVETITQYAQEVQLVEVAAEFEAVAQAAETVTVA
jgi:hypothetical protein